MVADVRVAGATPSTTIPPGPTTPSDQGESSAFVVDGTIVATLGLLTLVVLAGLFLLGMRRRRSASIQRSDEGPSEPERVALDQWFSQARRAAQQARLLLQETEVWEECDSGLLSDGSLNNLEPRVDLLTAQLVDAMATASIPEDRDLVRSVAICSQSFGDAVKFERRQRSLAGERDDRGVSLKELIPVRRTLDQAVGGLEAALGLS